MRKNTIKCKKIDSLNQDHNKLIRHILDTLLKALFGNIQCNIEPLQLNNQSMADIMLSCLVTFNREVILKLLLINHKALPLKLEEEIIDHIWSATKKEILKVLEEYKK